LIEYVKKLFKNNHNDNKSTLYSPKRPVRQKDGTIKYINPIIKDFFKRPKRPVKQEDGSILYK